MPYDERTVQAMLQLDATHRFFSILDMDGDSNYFIVRWPADEQPYDAYYCLEGQDPEHCTVDKAWMGENWDSEEHLHEMPLPLIILALADLEVARDDPRGS